MKRVRCFVEGCWIKGMREVYLVLWMWDLHSFREQL